MKPTIACGLAALFLTVCAAIYSVTRARTAEAADAKDQPRLAHLVYFSLKDNSEENKAKMVAACKKYLTDHPGTLFFAVGTLSELNRDVNDRDWDIALHMVFKDLAAHDAYQVAPRHLQFIEENKPSWKRVRVFDSDLAAE